MADLGRFLGFGRGRADSQEHLTVSADNSPGGTPRRHRHRHSASKSSDIRPKSRAVPRVASLFGLSGRESRQSHKTASSLTQTTTAGSSSDSPPYGWSPESHSPSPEQRRHSPSSVSGIISVEIKPYAPPEIPILPPPVQISSVGEYQERLAKSSMAVPIENEHARYRESIRKIFLHDPAFLDKYESLRITAMRMVRRMECLPKEYNADLLMVLEGLQHLLEHVPATQKLADQQKDLREKELEQFRDVSEEWIQKEAQYRAEIKRLELILAKESQGGMACVAMTRQGSLIDRAASKRLRQRIEKLNDRPEALVNSPFDDTADQETSSCYATGTVKENFDLNNLVRSATRYARINSEAPPREPERVITNAGYIPRFITPNNDALIERIRDRELARIKRRAEENQGAITSGGGTTPNASPSFHSTCSTSHSEPGPACHMQIVASNAGYDVDSSSSRSKAISTESLDEPVLEMRRVKKDRRHKKTRGTASKPENGSMETPQQISNAESVGIDEHPCRQETVKTAPSEQQKAVLNADSQVADDYFSHMPEKRPRRCFSFVEGGQEVLSLSPGITLPGPLSTAKGLAATLPSTLPEILSGATVLTNDVNTETEARDVAQSVPRQSGGPLLLPTSRPTISPSRWSTGTHSTFASSESTGSVIYVGASIHGSEESSKSHEMNIVRGSDLRPLNSVAAAANE